MTPPISKFSQDVARDDKRLIVPRGGDVSRWCFCCGKESADHITCHLRRNNSGVFHKGMASTSSLMFILDILEVVLYCAMCVADLPASRKRTVTYGLCDRHLQKRQLMLMGAPIVFLIGVGLFVWMFSHMDVPMYFGLPATIFGLTALVCGPALYFTAPGPALAGENPQYLWLKRGGPAFLDHYPAQAKPKPTTH